MAVFLDRQYIDADDFAVQFGLSLFETFLVGIGCRIFLLERHVDRLYRSLDHFNIDLAIRKDEFRQSVENYVRVNALERKVLRVAVTAGNRYKGIMPSILFSERDNPYCDESYKRGISLMIADFRRNETSPLVMHKTGNYLENLTAYGTARDKGCDDALFLNSRSEITETTKSNIFFVSKGTLHTPALDCGLLPGIIRGWVIEKAASIGISCAEGRYSLDELLDSDEVFATNSVMGVMPVACVNGHKKSATGENSVTRALMKLYEEK